jgi:acyl carrier protein
VQYRLLNIEQAPDPALYPPHGFDVVVASNVLHATLDLPQTIANARALLAPGGMLLMLEVTDHMPWFDITTGLIEGWERFDDELRKNNPLLQPDQWRDLLVSQGFETVLSFPEAGTPAEILGEHVIAALVPSEGSAAAPGAFSGLAEQPGTPAAQASNEPAINSADAFRAELEQMLADDRLERLLGFVRQQVALSLRMDASRTIDRRQRLMDLGLDSLMAVELRNRLGVMLGLKQSLPATMIFDYPTIEAIAGYLDRTIFAPSESAASQDVPPETAPEPSVSQAELETLSDDEVETLLLKKLKDL